MSLRSLSSRVLACHARPEAFVAKTQAILARLGYRIVPAVELRRLSEDRAEAGERWEPDAVIVDERRLAEIGEYGDLPVILLTGRHGIGRDMDPRVVGAIKRPAGLHDLYRLAQQVFEDTPRSTPRIPADLVVECGRDGRAWPAQLVSISENGGLLRCAESLPLGACFDLSFDLPGRGPIALRAEAAYQLFPDTGVVFSGLAPTAREAIGHFVQASILA